MLFKTFFFCANLFGRKINEPFRFENVLNLTHKLFIIILQENFSKFLLCIIFYKLVHSYVNFLKILYTIHL